MTCSKRKNGVSSCRLYLHYISIHIKGRMQYKASLLLSALGQFLVSFNVFLVFQRFSSVEGFTYSQVLLCFSIFLMEFTLAEIVARGFDTFSSVVRKGEFDRVLLRPRSPILQILGSRFELSRLSRLLQALVMFVYGIAHSGISWDFLKIVTVLFMLIGGTVLFSGIFLLYAGLCFFTLDGLEFMNIFTDGAREFGKYPVGVYGKRILQLCTFLIPYALVQYYPLLYILEQRTGLFWVFLPLGACFFLLPCSLPTIGAISVSI